MRRTLARPDPEPERREERRPRPLPAANDLRVPHDTVNECVLLAAAFRDPERRRELLRDVPAGDLFGKGHAEAWAALKELDDRSLAFSLDTLVQLGAGKVERDYFERLLELHPETPPNLPHHVEQLRWDAQRVRAAHGPLQELEDLFRDLACRPEVLAQKARQLADDLATTDGSSLEDPRALLAANAARRAARRAGTAVYPYGLDGFEREPDGRWRIKPGLAPGTLTTFTGVSGSGKSVAAKRVALAQVVDLERSPVLFGAWEEESGQVLEDLAWMQLGLDRDDVEEGRLDDAGLRAMAREEERLVAHVKFLRKPPTRRGDTNAGRIAWIANEVARSGAKVFVADLLDRVLPEDEVKDEARAWKEIANAAQQTGSAFLVVHQQRLKDVEQRPDKRPTREGVKGSAAIVEASDTLIGWHRRGLWKAVEDTAVEAIVLKQKRGKWPLAVEFDWDPKRASLRNGREVKYLRPGEEGSDVDGFIDRMQRGRGGRSGR